jgi:branched-chain amino acid transport system substrate-binding protein
VATLAPEAYPPAGQEFFEQYKAKYGDDADPYAIYGYDAMQLALDAIKRSGTGERDAILQAIFATEERESVLGTYSIDANGDTTLSDYGAYTIEDGELQFDQTIKAAA